MIPAQKRDEAEANYKAMEATEKAAKAQYEMARNGAQKEDKLAAEAQLNRARGAVSEVQAYVREIYLVSPIEWGNFRVLSESRRAGRNRCSCHGGVGFVGYVGLF